MKIGGGALWLISLMSVSAWATPVSQISDSTHHTLTEIIVEVPGSTSGVVMPCQKIGPQQLQLLSTHSVTDALRYLAGVQIKDYGGLGGQKTINVRSLGSQHVGVYLDGVRITNAQNGTVDLGKYSLSTLEKISLFNANKVEPLMAASEYASASTLYMRTHRPDSTRQSAAYQLGAFGTHRVNLNAQYKKYGFVDASYCQSEGNYPFRYHTQWEDTTGTRQNGDIKALRVEACGFFRGWQSHIYYYQSQRGLPGGIVRRLTDTYTDVGREWDRNFFAQLSYREHFGAWSLRGIIKYTNDRLHYRSDYPANIAAHANVRYHQQDLYQALSGSVEWNDCNLSASTDLRWSDLTTTVRHFHYVYRLDSKSALALHYRREGWSLSASGLYTHLTDHTLGQGQPLRRFTYHTQASHQWQHISLRSFYKSVFRAPTLNDLYYTLVGSRNLRPEYTQQFDIGISVNLSLPHLNLHLQSDAYYNRVRDRIVCLPLKGSYQWSMLNYGQTRLMGIDTNLQIDFLTAQDRYGKHSLLLTCTLQDDRNRSDRSEPTYNDYIAYSPRWSWSAVYTLLYKQVSGSISHQFVDRRYWTTQNSIEPPLPRYMTTDVKIGYACDKILSIELECQNLFDNRYELIQRWPMPGRMWLCSIKVKH